MMTISNLFAYQQLQQTFLWILQMIVVLLAVGEPNKVVGLHKLSEIFTYSLQLVYNLLKLFCIDQAQIFGCDLFSPNGYSQPWEHELIYCK